MGSVTELYTFMDAADATLARRLLGEGDDEDQAETADKEAAAVCDDAGVVRCMQSGEARYWGRTSSFVCPSLYEACLSKEAN